MNLATDESEWPLSKAYGVSSGVTLKPVGHFLLRGWSVLGSTIQIKARFGGPFY